MLAVLAGLALMYVVYKAARGATLSSGLGAYGGISSVHYSFGAVRHWTLLHFAEIGLSVAAMPLSALILLTGLAFWRGTPSAAERAFVAVAASGLIIVVVQAAVFASRFSLRIEERNMFHVAPLLLLALLVWIERGLPRPPLLTAVAAATPAVLLLALPLGTLITTSMFSDTFALIPLFRVENFFDGNVDRVRWLMIAGGVAAALLFAFVPRRFALVLPAAVALYLVLGSWTTYGALKDLSRGMANGTFGGTDASWIDNAIGTAPQVAAVFGPDTDFTRATLLWQTEFWNRSVAHVYNLGVPEPAGGLPDRTGTYDPARGLFTLAGTGDVRYVVVESDVKLAGKMVAQHGRLALYRLHTPIRLVNSTSGIYGDGWMGADASYTRYAADPPSTIRVSLSRSAWSGPDVPGHVKITVMRAGSSQPFATRRWVVHSSRRKRFVLPTPAGSYTVLVHIAPTFSPAQFGEPDTRQLGAQVEFGPGGVRGE